MSRGTVCLDGYKNECGRVWTVYRCTGAHTPWVAQLFSFLSSSCPALPFCKQNNLDGPLAELSSLPQTA
eukprot:221289-Chlamydomonas_euryale.AAC.12